MSLSSHAYKRLVALYRQILVKQWAPRRSRPASGTPLGIEPLEPRVLLSQTWHVTDAAWDVTDHGSLAYALSVASGGDTIQFNQSADTIQSTNLTVTAGVTFDLDGSTSTLTLSDSGAVAIDGNLTIVGGNLEIDAATSVTVAAGVAVSTGQSGLYSGNYNDLTFNSPSISIDDNVSILAQAGTGKQSGNVTLTSDDTASMTWTLGVTGFKDLSSTTAISIGAGARIEGNDVSITTTSSTTKSAELDSDLAHDVTAIVVGDVNGDGHSDMVVASADADVMLYLGAGSTTPFQGVTPIDISGTEYTTSLALGDLGNGRQDLVIGRDNNQYSLVYMNSGDANPFDGTPIDLGPGNVDTTSVAIGDVNGDGKADVVLGNSSSQSMVFLNNGTGTPFTQNGYTVVGSSSSDADDNTTSVALADVTGNGRADLVEGISGGPSKLFLSNGTSTPFSSAGIALGTGGDTDMTTSVVLANVTGHANGLPDLILGNDGQPDRLFVNSGDANPFDGTPYNIGDGTDDTTCLAVADVNGDGKPDLVVGNDGQQNCVYLNTGHANPFDGTPQTIGEDAKTTQAVAIGNLAPAGTARTWCSDIPARSRRRTSTTARPARGRAWTRRISPRRRNWPARSTRPTTSCSTSARWRRSSPPARRRISPSAPGAP